MLPTNQKKPKNKMTLPPFEHNKKLSEICTLGTGGFARFFVIVRKPEEMARVLRKCSEEKLAYFILGKGSNCLFDDRGFNGVIILNKIDFMENSAPGVFYAGAGYSFSLLGVQTARQGWSGLEFASGIPGSVGGAVYMNAGANGFETSQSLSIVEYVNEQGEFLTFSKEELAFAYRSSPFQKMRGAVIAAHFTLTPSEHARQKQLEIIAYRKKTQPYSEKSAGCFFKNPQCGHSGALIEQSGLKGFKIGGAQVSEMHANFIVNTDQATSEDIKRLVEHVKQTVKAKTGIELEYEVRFIPYGEENL